jgi:hypothetical protein
MIAWPDCVVEAMIVAGHLKVKLTIPVAHRF